MASLRRMSSKKFIPLVLVQGGKEHTHTQIHTHTNTHKHTHTPNKRTVELFLIFQKAVNTK